MKVVYCGGCNPHIDRDAVAAGLPVDDPDVPPGTTVHLSGCPRACASDHQLVAEGDEQAGAGAEGAPAGPDGPPVVVVAGELVDGVPTPPQDARPRRDAQAQGVRGWTGRRTTPPSARRRPRPSSASSPGDRVVFAHACGEPLDLVDALVARAGELEHVEINHMVAMGKGEYCRPEYADELLPQVAVRRRHVARGGQGRPRRLHPGLLQRDPQAVLRGLPAAGRGARPGVAAGQARLLLVRHLRGLHQAGGAGRQDGHRPGEPARCRARTATRSSTSREIDYVVESEQPTSSSCSRRGIGPVEEAIGRHIAGLVEDGSCLQLGIGGIPDAVLLFLHEKNDLGIHTEMFSDGVVDLYNEGVITNARQEASPRQDGRHLPHGHAAPLRLRRRQPRRRTCSRSTITNDPYVIGQNDRVVAINSAIQVDLMGQVVRRLHGRRAVHRHRRPGRLRPRRRAQPRRQGHHRPAVHGQEGHRQPHRRRHRARHRRHHHARRRGLRRHRARGRAPARPRAPRARRGAHRDRRPGVP